MRSLADFYNKVSKLQIEQSKDDTGLMYEIIGRVESINAYVEGRCHHIAQCVSDNYEPFTIYFYADEDPLAITAKSIYGFSYSDHIKCIVDRKFKFVLVGTPKGVRLDNIMKVTPEKTFCANTNEEVIISQQNYFYDSEDLPSTNTHKRRIITIEDQREIATQCLKLVVSPLLTSSDPFKWIIQTFGDVLDMEVAPGKIIRDLGELTTSCSDKLTNS